MQNQISITDQQDISAVRNYATRLRQYLPDNLIVQSFREQYPNQFEELCLLHLSFLIDIPWSLIEQKSSNFQFELSSKSVFKRLFHGCRSNNNITNNNVDESKAGQYGINFNPNSMNHLTTTVGTNSCAQHSIHRADAIPPKLAHNIMILIDRLDTNEACLMEGIFRKAGSTVRRRELYDALLEGGRLESKHFAWSKYSYYDLAATLKYALVHSDKPLLTKRLMPLFQQVSQLVKLTASTMEEKKTNVKHAPGGVTNKEELLHALITRQQGQVGSQNGIVVDGTTAQQQHAEYHNLIESKQLKALRLLIQLLPRSNYVILKRLLELLDRVNRLHQHNRMNSECLGTVFCPVLLPQSILHNESVTINKSSKNLSAIYKQRCNQLSHLTTLLINTGATIFYLPRALVEDIYTNIPKLVTVHNHNQQQQQQKHRQHNQSLCQTMSPSFKVKSSDDADADDDYRINRLVPQQQQQVLNYPVKKKHIATSTVMRDSPDSVVSGGNNKISRHCRQRGFAKSSYGSDFVDDCGRENEVEDNSSPVLQTGIRFATPIFRTYMNNNNNSNNFVNINQNLNQEIPWIAEQQLLALNRLNAENESISKYNTCTTDISSTSSSNNSNSPLFGGHYLMDKENVNLKKMVVAAGDDDDLLSLAGTKAFDLLLTNQTPSTPHYEQFPNNVSSSVKQQTNIRAFDREKSMKRRRYTEIRAPHSPDSNEHRRFSPCPSIGLAALRKIVDRRNAVANNNKYKFGSTYS